MFFGIFSCKGVVIKETEFCGVSGLVTHGADCATTIENKTRSMSMEEFIDFLTPDPTRNKSGALCQSVDDVIANKTSLEQACKLLKNRCTKEMKQMIESFDSAVKHVVKP